MNTTELPSPLNAGLRLLPLPNTPGPLPCGADMLTNTVEAVQPDAPAQVLRTNTSSRLFVSFATRLLAKEANAMYWSVAGLRLGCSLAAFPAVAPSGATDTSEVAGVQPAAPVQVSRR